MTEALEQAWGEHGGLPASKSLSRWCRRLQDLGSALLPIKLGDATSLVSLAVSAAEWRVLHYVIQQAFTGEMLDVAGEHAPNEVPSQLRDAMEAAGVREWRVHAIRDARACRGSYAALNAVEDRRASLEGSIIKTSGQLIRRFRSAVDGEDGAAAQQCLEELKSYQTVDRYNVAFLALWSVVRLQPSLVHSSPELDLALRQHERMPFDLRDLVGRVVLEHTIAPWVAAHGVERLDECIGGSQPMVPTPLFDQCCTLTTPVGAAFRVLAAPAEPNSWVSAEDWPTVIDAFSWLTPAREKLGGKVVEESPEQKYAEKSLLPDESGSAQGSLTSEQQIRDCASRISTLNTSDVYSLLSLVEKGDEDADDVLRQWWDRLGQAERQESRGLAPFTEALAKADEASDPHPENWLAYMTAGVDAAGFSFGDLPLVVDENSDEQWRDFAECLETFDERRFIECLPTLTRAWSASPKHQNVTAAFIDKVYLTLLEDEGALGSGNRVDDLSAFLDVALEAGFSTQQYGDFLEQLGGLVQGISSYRLLEELIDVLELLVDGKYPDPDALSELLRAFQAAAQAHCTRMDRSALDVLCALLEFRGLTDEVEALRKALPPEAGDDESVAGNACPVRGKKVLIYTLDQPSGERAKNLVEKRFGAAARTDNSKQASAALKGALRWADIVICVTRAAQHAATNEIDRRASKDALIRPGGKGSSSILRDLGKWRAEHAERQ